jgi:DNA-binding MarR family transcriptional regulator
VSRRPTVKRQKLIEELDRQNRRTGSLGGMHSRAIADRAGLNDTDFECIDVLDWTGPITAGELGRRVGITSGAVTGVLDRLERGGWVRRTADSTDRRRVIVELCPLGQDGPNPERYKEMAEAFAPLQSDIEAIVDDLSDDQLATIVEYLRASSDAVERSIERMRRRSS